MKGQVIDKNIKLVREIGTGAFGSIFLGKNINSGRECAVKIEKAEKTTGLL
jgi:serine/threonine protein kinase